jgi:Transposase DDE domain
LIDSTIVPAHAPSAGAQKKHGTQSLGRSRGGHSTKIHLATDALGNAIRFILTGGERNDITQVELLLENLFPEYVQTRIHQRKRISFKKSANSASSD